jgi:hypothetical protein
VFPAKSRSKLTFDGTSHPPKVLLSQNFLDESNTAAVVAGNECQ